MRLLKNHKKLESVGAKMDADLWDPRFLMEAKER